MDGPVRTCSRSRVPLTSALLLFLPLSWSVPAWRIVTVEVQSPTGNLIPNAWVAVYSDRWASMIKPLRTTAGRAMLHVPDDASTIHVQAAWDEAGTSPVVSRRIDLDSLDDADRLTLVLLPAPIASDVGHLLCVSGRPRETGDVESTGDCGRLSHRPRESLYYDVEIRDQDVVAFTALQKRLIARAWMDARFLRMIGLTAARLRGQADTQAGLQPSPRRELRAQVVQIMPSARLGQGNLGLAPYVGARGAPASEIRRLVIDASLPPEVFFRTVLHESAHLVFGDGHPATDVTSLLSSPTQSLGARVPSDVDVVAAAILQRADLARMGVYAGSNARGWLIGDHFGPPLPSGSW